MSKLAVGGAILVAVLLRLRWITSLFSGDFVRLTGTDPYYHLRRIKLALDNGFSIPSVDPFCHFPDGVRDPWPPLFDLFNAAVAWIVGLGAPSDRTIATVAVLMPPVLGAVAVWLVYRLGRRLVGRRAATIAAWVYAVLPAVVYRSQAGVADHHAAEAVLALAVYLSVSGPALGSGTKRGMAIGLSVAAAYLTWLGAAAFVGVAALWLLVRVVLRADHPTGGRIAKSGAIGFGLAALIVVPFAAMTEAGRAGAFRTFHLSWLQPLELAIVALIAAACYFGAAWCRAGTPPWQRALTIIIGVGCGFGAGVAGLAGRGVLEGIAFARRPTPVILLPRESQPLLVRAGQLDFERVWLFYGTGVIAAAVGLFVLWRRRRAIESAGFLALLTIVHVTLALFQTRFVHFAAVEIALLSGLAGVALGRLTGRPIAVAVIAVAIILPGASIWLLRFGPNPPPVQIETALRALRAQSAPVDPVNPEYGVAAHWDLGHWLNAIAERPSLDSTFLHLADLKKTSAVFMAATESELNEIADRERIRYVVSLPIPETQSPDGGPDPYRYLYPRQYIHVLGLSESDYLTPAPGGLAVTPRFTETMQFRLQYLNGVRPVDGRHPGFPDLGPEMFEGGTLRTWRLAIATDDPARPGPGSRVKIFERVGGAVLTGTLVPRARIELRAIIRTPLGKAFGFVYADRVQADENGRFSFRVPYWGRHGDDVVGVDGAYDVFCSTLRWRRAVEVTERDVRAGRTVPVR